MIVPNVFNAPLSASPVSWMLEEASTHLSTTDFFRSWEPVPENGAMAFPRFTDAYGSSFRRDSVRAGETGISSLCFLRSSWTLLASAARRWKEFPDADGLPGDPDIVLRFFRESPTRVPGDWRFVDGSSLPRKCGKLRLDDHHGRRLEISQESSDSDLVVASGWQLDFGGTSLLQEMRVSPQGRSTTSYRMVFGQNLFEGLMEAVDLKKCSDPERLAMRLAGFIERSGQFAASPEPVVVEKSEIRTSKTQIEETVRIGFARKPGTSVALKRSFLLPIPKSRKPYNRSIEIQIRPDGSSDVSGGPSSLHPLLLEKLWNPAYVRALYAALGEPPSA